MVCSFKQPEIVKKYGYPVDVHDIVTEDGYTLQLHRIPYSPKDNEDAQWRKARSPILLVHGLAGSSADWIITGPEKALGLSALSYISAKILLINNLDKIMIKCCF